MGAERERKDLARGGRRHSWQRFKHKGKEENRLRLVSYFWSGKR